MSSAFPLRAEGAELYVPDDVKLDLALSRCSDLGVGAHQDDLEIMAWEPIARCYDSGEEWFCGVTSSDGSGSARSGPFAHFSDEQMMAVRREEQRRAAKLGRYGAQFQLNHPSSLIKKAPSEPLVEDYLKILKACRPKRVYTHNLADKHDTHVAVALRLISALRRLPPSERPERLIGCEVWRDLDWLHDPDKLVMDVSRQQELAHLILGVFESQIAGGKRYDLAALGRRRANATFFESHAVDQSQAVIFGMDMSPLLKDDGLDPFEFCKGLLGQMEAEIKDRLSRLR